MGDVQDLRAIGGERSDSTALPHAKALQRLHELTRHVADFADREHRPAGQLQKWAVRRLTERVDKQIRHVLRSVEVVCAHLVLERVLGWSNLRVSVRHSFQNVDSAGATEANHVREAQSSPLDLTLASLAT